MKCITVRLHTVVIFAAILLGAGVLFAVHGDKVVSALATPRALPIYSVAREDKQIALTFDTSYGDNTTELLRVLADAGVSATFFVTGDWADRHGDSVRAMHEAGHEVMNHSNTHPHMTRLTVEEIHSEVSACNEKIKALTGTVPTLFRPPFGDYDDQMIRALQQCGMTAVHWDVERIDSISVIYECAVTTRV